MKNLKKVISSVAALTIVASSVSAFAVTFPDVDSSASYANAVDTLVALNIVNGDDNGLFNPDNNVTRAEFTKMAVGALGEISAAEAQTTSKFDDAANTSVHWAAGYVAQGVADGFINGYDDHRFGPDDQVTYAQAAKMLVAAVGYTSYAEASGGWPSGYVSQASSLDITKGVSATNDTNLTRAQCAVMIYNAMQVPLCVIDSWKTETTFAGTVSVPELKKLDGKENRDYQTLLTDKHDAYVVKGRVTANAKGSADGLEKDEVRYDVEVSDNFDETINISKSNNNMRLNEKFKVGTTNAADLLFAYTEAIVQKDDDTGEFTILSISNYGNSKSVSFKADDVADDDTQIGKDYTKNMKLPVYKSSTTSSTTKYDLANDARIYVNGVNAGAVTNEKIDEYILKNTTGEVTLIDKTEVGSTSTDGNYDYIMVTYYVDAVVDYITTSSSYARIYFKDQQTRATKMEWDPDDKDVDITFTKDGAEIAYTDLNEFDVLSIQYNIVDEGTASGSLDNKEYYNVVVSSNVVEGNVTSRDTTDQTVTVDGNEYDLVEEMLDAADFELGTQYALYIDAFGYVAYQDEGTSDKNYGVIVASYMGSGDDYPTVRFITSDAKVVAYECKDNEQAKKFYNYAKNGDENGSESWKAFTKSDSTIGPRIREGLTVVGYKITSGKVKFDKTYTAQGGKDLEYKANSSKIGSYSISDTTTKIIDMDDYMKESNSGSTVSTLAVSDFEDEADYTAYFYDKNNDSVYRFAIVFEGTSSIRPETQLAVVKKSNGQKDVDSTTCSAYTVFRAGAEAEMLYDVTDSTLAEGTVIAYTVGSEGYVEDGDLYVIYTPKSSYDASFSEIIAKDDFGSILDNVQKVTSGKNAGKYEIAYNGKTSTSKDVLAYLGVVYRKSGNSLELMTGSTDIAYTDAEGKPQVKKGASVKTTDISLGSANVYMFDYNKKDNKGERLTVGSTSQSTSVFNQAYVNDKNAVVWDNLDGSTPQFAFVKEVDGDATDVVLFVAP